MGMASHSGGSIINLIINCDLSLLRCFSLDVCSCFPEKSSFALFASWREIFKQETLTLGIFSSQRRRDRKGLSRRSILGVLGGLARGFQETLLRGRKGLNN